MTRTSFLDHRKKWFAISEGSRCRHCVTKN